MLQFPEINPTIIKLGVFEIRWYGLFYIVGFLIAYIFVKKSYAQKNIELKKEDYETLLFNLMLGVIIGGRLGYILFYNFQYYLSNPLQILAVWQGGMSFHGGAIGVLVFGYLFCKKHNYNFYK
ncbi:MAG: prolipoprotein diacylglyceryl transferase, partial [Candidatus Cloacimonetes bacterium]|nr:prolipoprotein diacylglyceryl transferase [Candidatus Cloacimonadota bacterium]